MILLYDDSNISAYLLPYSLYAHHHQHDEHGCMRVDAGLGRHQSLSRNLVNPCPTRYIPLDYNPMYYIALHSPVLWYSTIPFYYTTSCSLLKLPVLHQSATFSALNYMLQPATILCISLLNAQSATPSPKLQCPADAGHHYMAYGHILDEYRPLYYDVLLHRTLAFAVVYLLELYITTLCVSHCFAKVMKPAQI